MSSPLRVAVVGCGSIGMRHLAILAAFEDVEPVAVPARADRAPELREQGVPAATWDEAVAGGLDGTVVATGTERHAADVARALDAGCAVLAEKPIAGSVAAAAPVTDHPRCNVVHVAYNLRFDRGLQWIARRLESIGTLRAADIECLGWLPDWRPGRDHRQGYAARAGSGGVLLDLSHELDYAHWLFGAPKQVTARLGTGALGLEAGVDDTALLLAEHPAATVTMRLSFAVRPPSRRLRAWGEHGMLEWDGYGRVALQRDPDGSVAEEVPCGPIEATYEEQDAAWVAGLRDGAFAGELAGLDDALGVLATCDAARAAG